MRSRGNSHSDRRRTDRDVELRRRRHRQWSQASDRFNRLNAQFDIEFPALSRPSLASSSSMPGPSRDTPTASQTRTVAREPDFFGPSVFATQDAAQLNALPTPVFSFGNNARVRMPPSRSRSDDGSQQTTADAMSDQYSRTIAEIQEQLDSMRALLNGNTAEDTRHSLASAAASLHQERTDLEEDLLAMMEDSDSAPAPTWTRIRHGMGTGERPRKQPLGLRGGGVGDEGRREMDELNRSCAFLYSVQKAPTGSDVWPDMRDPAKTPAKFAPVDLAAPRLFTSRASQAFSGLHGTQHDWDYEDNTKKPVWPMNELPSEIYYQIIDHLSRDDIKAMRLTCKEMEYHISGILFKNVVVPFNAEIYGMLLGIPKPKLNTKGKGKTIDVTPPFIELWKNNKDLDIYTGHGVDVFRSFGSSMKRFGMSFEVDEEVLVNPPLKGTREDHKSYWGVYQWPYPEYKRFDQVAGLEDAADETPKMKTAFSFLGKVEELALSLDAGLGWLNGPDRSIRSRVLGEYKPVFGMAQSIPDRMEESRQWLWAYLKRWASSRNGIDLRQCAAVTQKFVHPIWDFTTLKQSAGIAAEEPGVPYFELQGLVDPSAKPLPPLGSLARDDTARTIARRALEGPEMELDFSETNANTDTSELGVLFVKEDAVEHDRLESYPIVPSELSKLQKEWLLETEWAQRAFLSSWLIAVVDNRMTFQNVHTLSFARISSRFLMSLCREDLWKALPQLEVVKLNVIPDCRDVLKDNAGFVDTPRVLPISSVWLLHKLIAEMIALRSSIKTLEIGWVGGGEHAQGLTARNKHLMPAPILPPEWLGSAENMADKRLLEQRMLRLPHLARLTVKNCWITPHALTFLVQEHVKLQHLCLESVSLSAEPVNNNGPNLHQIMAMAQQLQGPLMPVNTPPVALPPDLTALNNPQHGFMQAVQNVNNLAVATGFNAPVLQQNTSGSDWLSPRVGSWPYVLDAISPGITLAAAGCVTCPVNLTSTIPNHALQTLEIKSAGYCRLNNARLDESVIPPPTFGGGSPWFSKRFGALSKVMLNTRGTIMAEIVQALPQSEEHALVHGLDMQLGWPPEWADEVEAPTFDACLPGGTGRFSGSIDVSSRVKSVEE